MKIYNPSGGSGGAVAMAYTVNTYSDLNTTYPAADYTGAIALVLTSTYLSIPWRLSGLYYSDGVNWTRKTAYNDDRAIVDGSVIFDDADKTKRARFEASGISTGTTRVYDLPDDDGTLALLENLPSNIFLYATDAVSGIGTYTKLVSSIDDPDYDTVAVDIATPAITGTGIFIAGLVSEAGILVGNPGIVNLSTVGNVKRVSGVSDAEFYYEVYKRDSVGTETLLTTSSTTGPVITSSYEQFSAVALLNDGTFLATDRIVIKYYGNKLDAAVDSVYNFQFGGSTPVRTYLPVPLDVTLDWERDAANGYLHPKTLTDKVGIGINTPTAKEHIVGEGTTSVTYGLKVDDSLGNNNLRIRDDGYVDLPNTTNANKKGIISKDGTPFIHNFNYGDNGTVTTNGQNIFIGKNSGNFTMGSTATATYQASYNTAQGYTSFSSNTTGSYNTAQGVYSLYSNTTGNYNAAQGTNAGRFIADGLSPLTISNQSVFLGSGTKALADNSLNELVIGYNAIGNGNNTTTIGNSSITHNYFNGNIETTGSVKVADDTDVASADKVGTFRYRADANNSYVDVCVQTGATTYAWRTINQETW